MSGLSKICRRSSGLWVLAFLAAGLWTQTPARGADEVVSINVDQAQLLNLPDRVATIIIGNPLIADATVQGGGGLVVTGKGYGMTNLLALDRNGRVLMSRMVEVRGAGTSDVVTVYKGIEREILQLRAELRAPDYAWRTAGLLQCDPESKRSAQWPGTGCREIATPDAIHGFHAYRSVNASTRDRRV